MNVAQKLTSAFVASVALLGMVAVFTQISNAAPKTKANTHSITLNNATPDKIVSWMQADNIQVVLDQKLLTKGKYNLQLRNATSADSVTIFAQMLGVPYSKIGDIYYIGDKPSGPLKTGGHMKPGAVPRANATQRAVALGLTP